MRTDTLTVKQFSKDYLGEIKAETDLNEAAKMFGVDPKAEMWKLPMNMLDITLSKMHGYVSFMQHFKHVINKESLDTVWQMERDLLPTLIDMRWKCTC